MELIREIISGYQEEDLKKVLCRMDQDDRMLLDAMAGEGLGRASDLIRAVNPTSLLFEEGFFLRLV